MITKLNEFVEKLYEYYNSDDYFEIEDRIRHKMFNDFLYNNNEKFTKNIYWTVIPFPRLKKIWEDYINVGIVRDTKGLDMIKSIMIGNTIKVNIFTELAGHTEVNTDEYYEDTIGYFVDDQLNCYLPINKNECTVKKHPFIEELLINKFDENYEEDYNKGRLDRNIVKSFLFDEMLDLFIWNYMNDSKNELGGFVSDYGLRPLMKLLYKLLNSDEPEETLTIIDKMLNVIHQRSDIAAWFVQGGSNSLDKLSGYYDETGDSKISGKYRMADYR
jgi:hypothetical protein